MSIEDYMAEDCIAAVAKITAERDAAVARAEAAEANYRFMVERAADQKLDGYRALASRLEASDLRAYRLEAALRAIVESDATAAVPCSGEGCPFCEVIERGRAALKGEM
jgi:hypothetical protein